MKSSEQVKCVTRHGEESIQEGLQKLPGAKRSHWRPLSRGKSQSDILKDFFLAAATQGNRQAVQ